MITRKSGRFILLMTVTALFLMTPAIGAVEGARGNNTTTAEASHSGSECQLGIGQTSCESSVWTYRETGTAELPDLKVDPAAVGSFMVKIQGEGEYHVYWTEIEFEVAGGVVIPGERTWGYDGLPASGDPVRTYGYSEGGVPLPSVTATHRPYSPP